MIIVSDDLNESLSNLDGKIVKSFEVENFLVENAKEVINEAFIKEERQKVIIIRASSFTNEAQNSLLKLLEEPPSGVEIILVARSKNIFLPTILSREIVVDKRQKKDIKLDFDIKKLNSLKILELIEHYSSLESKNELDKFDQKELFFAIIKECFLKGIKFNEFELSYINKLIVLIELNTKIAYTLSPLLLLILEKNSANN